MNERRGRIYAGIFLGAAVLFAAGLSFVVLRPFFSALAWAIVLAVAFQKPWRYVASRIPKRRGLAAAIASGALAFVVLVPTAILGGVLVAQASDTATRFARELKSRNIVTLADVTTVPGVAKVLTWVESTTGMTPDELQAKLTELAGNLSTEIAKTSGALVLGVLDTLLTFATTIFLLFFLFRDGDAMASAAVELIPLPAEERDRAAASLTAMLESIFRGSLLCALIQGVTGGLGWAMAGLSSPALAGAVMAVLSLLPIGGTAIVWAPGAIFLWLTGHHGAALFLAAWGAVVTSFLADNVLKPLLIRGAGELDTLVVFLGVFGGLSAFGLLGLFIGPITLAVAIMLLQVLRSSARAAVPENGAAKSAAETPGA